MKNEKIRNVAIIAHVDHGKTSLVNEMLKQGHVFRDNQQVDDRVMDSNALERERGITILAKNTAVFYNGVKINVVDTPGHADFGGEVERVLKMVDGVLLVVDAFEGPMPQTRFVLEKALELNLKVIVVINKIDRPDARVQEVQDEVLELFMDLNASDDQLNSPFLFASARQGVCGENIAYLKDMTVLFQKIIDYIPAPDGEEDKPFQMLISATEQNEYVGKLAVGKIARGKVKVGDQITLCNFFNDKTTNAKIVSMYQFEGLKRVPCEISVAGDIAMIAGIESVTIGDTLCSPEKVEPLEFVKISEPSVEMTFLVNDSPFAGKEGKFVTSRHLRERLYREQVKDLSLRVRDTKTTEAFTVCGRGEMHLSILIENMRREGYEFQVSMPRVVFKEIDGKKYEPIDRVVLDVPEDCVGVVMNKLGVRKGELVSMTPHTSRMRMEFKVPSRGMFGFKSDFLTDTRGEGIFSAIPEDYEPYKGEIARREYGSLIAFESGESITYGLFNAQERGDLFIGPGIPVYAGMVVGRNPRGEDLVVNVCKKKHLSNCRSSGADEALRLIPPIQMSLEDSLEFLADDEYMEVTPKSIRIRKVVLDHNMRLRIRGKALQNQD